MLLGIMSVIKAFFYILFLYSIALFQRYTRCNIALVLR